MTAPAPVSRTGAEALHAAIDATGCRACGALDHPSGCAADVASNTRTGATDWEVEVHEDVAVQRFQALRLHLMQTAQAAIAAADVMDQLMVERQDHLALLAEQPGGGR